VNQPTKLHKSYMWVCTKGKRVGEGGGETIHLNSQPPLPCCPNWIELHIVVLGKVVPQPNVPMADCHLHKAYGYGLVFQQVGVDNNEGLSVVEPCISMTTR
jgi:hypothetical protein